MVLLFLVSREQTPASKGAHSCDHREGNCLGATRWTTELISTKPEEMKGQKAVLDYWKYFAPDT